MESSNYHELRSRPYYGIFRFLLGKNVVIMICKSGRHRAVANAQLWSNTLTRYGRIQHSVYLLRLSDLDFWKYMCRKVFGMQQTMYQNLPDTLRLRPS